jgi:putative PIN family toxin of toxin-antitoxin system
LISATLDTNIHIRAFNFGGPAALLFGYPRSGKLRIDISEAILQETADVLREKFERDPYMIHDVRQKLEALCKRVFPTQVVDVVREDPDDNRILEYAAAANSDYIVSEDRDLLRLGSYEGISIVTLADFLTIALNDPSGKTV